MQQLPGGTVTFLFTDIQGSTNLAQALGERWPPVLVRHLELLESAVAANQGQVFGTEGDAISAVFATAPRAVQAAVDAQRALASEPWPDGVAILVRCGLHTGEGRLQGDNYVGIDLHRVARITNAGHGGQVLLSATTRMLAESALPAGVTIRELGEYRLKDLSRPEQLSMLVIEGLPDSFPALRTLDAVPNNLPTQLTSFLGREREIAEARDLLAEARLLTLTGPGGTGKTRLSLQLAADVTDGFADGVYFVPLGTIGEARLVLPTIAQALGLPDPGGRALERLSEQLAGKRVLLVLDNVEQVLDAAPEIGELLARLPELRILATSRSPLRIYGEQEYPVPPLQLPDPRHLPDFEGLSQYASVALFIERAMSVRPDFRVDASNAPAIAEICVQLDGLPLAIELAAARVRVLTPQAILSRLGDRLSLLAGGSRNLPERQQTLRGAIDWSHDLLDETDRLIFARFSVFAGGADLDAVEGVVLPEWPAEAGPAPDGLEALTSLLDKSLVRQEVGAGDQPRFRMLGSIRAYATERLAEREATSLTRACHAEYFCALVERAATELFSPAQRRWLDALEREHDNLRAAIAFTLEEQRTELALRLLAATWRFWQMRGYLPEGRERAERILALPDVAGHPTLRVRAVEAAGGIAYWQGDITAARAWYDEQREVAVSIGDRRGEAEALYNQCFTFSVGGDDMIQGRALAEEARQRFHELGDRLGEGRALWAMVNSYIFEEDIGPAAEIDDQAIALFREVDDRFMLGWALYTRALIHARLGEYEAAHAALVEALGIFRATDDVSGYALVLDSFASLVWLRGDRDRAMRIAGAAAVIQDVSGVGLAEANRQAAQFSPKEAMSVPELAAAFAEGQRLNLEEAIELALRDDATADGSPRAGEPAEAEAGL
ncbi:MAG TPA: AAA family ATPase [Candidatus Limnocylindria bacterium]